MVSEGDSILKELGVLLIIFLVIGSNGIQTEEIKELGRRIDDELEFVKQKQDAEVKG